MSSVSIDQANTWLAAALGVPRAFPWQERLLKALREEHCPAALDIPTGLGKTSVMAIWLVARVCGARLPRRLVYVVDRRAVVDQATEVAEELRELVEKTPELRERLGVLALPISTLRGQFVDNREWLADPTAPAIVVGTVDMVGSRLLFEGYGVSKKTRSFHAGMLGADTLLVLDEAHLVPSFERTLRAIESDARLHPREEHRQVIPRFQLMSLSATGRDEGAPFRLDAMDEDHVVVRKRLTAEKKLVLRAAVSGDGGALPEALAQEAWELSENGIAPVRCIVFCNGRSDALKVQTALQERLAKAKKEKAKVGTDCVALLVGGRRVKEREDAAAQLKQLGFLAGSKERPEYACFVVATAAGEVGVDLDADHMVSDLVAWERMVQRLGRVNRRGEGKASVFVVPTLPNKKEQAALDQDEDKLNDEERGYRARRSVLAKAAQLIERLPRGTEGAYDASPGALRALKEKPELAQEIEAGSTPAPLFPALTRAVVDSWSMTSLDYHSGKPDVQPWLRGWVDEEPQTQVIWREMLPVDDKGQALGDAAEAFFDAASPQIVEGLERETTDVLQWLYKRAELLFKGTKEETASEQTEETAEQEQDEVEETDATQSSDDVDTTEGSEEAAAVRAALRRDDVLAFVLPAGDKPPEAITARTLLRKDRFAKRFRGDLERMLMGATLVVDARVGGLKVGLLEERSDTAKEVPKLPFRVALRKVDAEGDLPATEAGFREELRLPLPARNQEEPTRFLIVESDLQRAAETEEGRSVSSRAQRLDEHQAWAEREARRIAGALKLGPAYEEMLALAARLHDEGKAAKNWQRAFKADLEGREFIWGKTRSRPNQALLDGYRHEFGSLLRVESHSEVRALDDSLRELCLHLITAHHGFGRPSIRTDGCDDKPPTALRDKAQEVALRFTRLEQEWGPWGLAWWETLLRAADQEASRQNDDADKKGKSHG